MITAPVSYLEYTQELSLGIIKWLYYNVKQSNENLMWQINNKTSQKMYQWILDTSRYSMNRRFTKIYDFSVWIYKRFVR